MYGNTAGLTSIGLAPPLPRGVHGRCPFPQQAVLALLCFAVVAVHLAVALHGFRGARELSNTLVIEV